MKSSIQFAVPGIPVAKGRPRISMRGGHARAYTPDKTVRYENLVAMSCPPQSSIAEGPVCVTISAYFPRPKRLCARSLRTGKLLHSDEHAVEHASRPDLDNVIKAVLDGLSTAGIWKDDAQVYSIIAEKYYCAIGDQPRVTVLITIGA